jgi:3',5'-cyclic AMP phosphodiesterase CpdA
VALILQLGDLHLGHPDAAHQEIGDYKQKFIPPVERQTRVATLRHTLRGLSGWLLAKGLNLDAVVVVGDVTTQHDETGFQALPGLLEELGEHLPDAERVIVVPGNHDVAWGTSPSSAERYRLFLDHIRSRGYRTPYLEGVDIDEHGSVLATSEAEPLLTLDEGAITLVAINSVNYSGAVEPSPLTNEQQDELRDLANTNEAVAALLGHTRRLSIVDAARVSPAQLVAVAALLRSTPVEAVRAVVLHHHLLPVVPNEEVKSYESITNLGEFREFAAGNGVNLVLHGHKHAAKAYLDLAFETHEVAVGRSEFVRRSPVLVSSVGHVGEFVGPPAEAARLIEISTKYAASRRIAVRSIHGLSAGAAYSSAPFPQVAATRVDRDVGSAAVHVYDGATVDDVYDQLASVFDDAAPDELLRTVICHITEGDTALRPPASYGLVVGESPDQWFDDVVDWWQHPDPVAKSPRFNHGTRIFRGFGSNIDQVADVADALATDPTTTRGVVILIDPTTDEIADTTGRLPSFCLAQFLIDQEAAKVDCIGYFRKQQMRVWWPVNACELARLQQRVVERLREHRHEVNAGSITTISAQAIAGTQRPRVLVPWIDRLADERPNEVWEIVLDLFDRNVNAAEVLETWDRIFNDWLPGEMREPDGVPLSLTGLGILETATRTLSARAADKNGEALAGTLRSMQFANNAYSRIEDLPRQQARERQGAYEEWVGQIRELHEAVMGHVRLIVADREDTTPPE